MPDDVTDAAQMAAIAAAAGGAARVALAMHGGVRAVGILAVEGMVGSTLGIIAAAAAVYWDPGLREAGWPLLMVGGVAGLSGALGTRILDMVVAAVQARLPPGSGPKP